MDDIIKKACNLSVGMEMNCEDEIDIGLEEEEDDWGGGCVEKLELVKKSQKLGGSLLKKHYSRKFLQMVFGRKGVFSP